MLRQFEWIRDGKRRNANPDMVKQIKEFSDDDDMKMVINYTSRHMPRAELLAPSKDYRNRITIDSAPRFTFGSPL